MYLFINPTSGEVWSEFRDDRDALAKGGFGEPLVPCSKSTVGCYRAEGGRPLLSAAPAPDFLNGEFRYSARPKTYWSWDCTEIAAISEQGTTTSVVCPVVGLVEFSISAPGGPAPVERYQLRSFNGLFAQR